MSNWSTASSISTSGYDHLRARLVNLFREHNFIELVRNGGHKTISVESFPEGSNISITFPGYKALVSGPYIRYDYRVDISKEGTTTSLSHANVIVDILQKCLTEDVPPQEMRLLLQELAVDPFANLADFPHCAKHRPTSVSVDLIEKARRTHIELGKTFNDAGNRWSLTFPELMASIRWIVSQEDVNYPIHEGRQGRRMPFARYQEATYCVTGECTLELVLQRALAHSIPSRLAGIDYRFLWNVR